jgi:hypothetical protein
VTDIREMTNLLPSDDYRVRLVVDTNALLDNPDLAYTGVLGAKYVVHLLPVVLREIDNLKRPDAPRSCATPRSARIEDSKAFVSWRCARRGPCRG